MSIFKPATRERVYLKLGVTGGPGDGKTTSALRLATGLADGGKICGIDTENSSMSLYADRFKFDTLNLSAPFTEDKFVTGIKAAESEGYTVTIIDSLSHSWLETLEEKTALDARGGNSFTNWGVAGRKFKNVMNAVLQSRLHVICCLRSKMSYVLETDNRGKQTPRKIGMEAISRDGTEYELTCVYDCGSDHYCTCSKDRTNLFINKHFQITEDTGRQLLAWLNSAPLPEPVVPPGAPPPPPNGKAEDFTHEGTIEIATKTPNAKGKACYGAELDGTKVYTFDPKLGDLLLSLDNLPAKLHLRPTGRPGYFEILDIEVPEPTPADTGEDQDPF